MSYNPILKEIFDTQEMRDIKKLDIVSQREIFDQQSAEMLAEIDKTYDVTQDDIYLDNNTFVRRYSPSIDSDESILFIHGGGWCVGSVNSYDNVCRYLCDKSCFNVFSLEYGLSPENKFPIAVNQAIYAYDWLSENSINLGINKQNITVMGDSAGGNFATIICHERQGNMPKSQVLIYPAVDMYTQYPSNIKYNKYMYHLTSAWCDKFMEAYLYDDIKYDREKLKNPKISPLFYKDTKQPKTLLLAATHDILIDGIYEYEKKLINDGTDVQTYYDDEMFHGFISTIDISPLPNAQKALDYIVKFLKN